MILLGGANQERQASGGLDQGGGYGQDGVEAFDGAQRDQVEGGWGKGFGAHVLYIDVRQCKGAGKFAEEGGFLVAGFDQGQRDVGCPEFEGHARESGTRAEIGDGEMVVGRWSLVVRDRG